MKSNWIVAIGIAAITLASCGGDSNNSNLGNEANAKSVSVVTDLDLNGNYNVTYFEQNKIVLTPEFEQLKLRFTRDGKVLATMQNAEWSGNWKVNKETGKLEINITGNDLAAFISSDAWEVKSHDSRVLKLEAKHMEMSKFLEVTKADEVVVK